MEPQPRTARRLRRTGIALGAAAAAVIGVAAAAWFASPGVGDLQARVSRTARSEGAAPVPLSSVAPIMRQAVVAAEDERFFRHHGIDTFGVMRAVAYDVTHLSLAEGASTIPEQLAKVLYLNGNDRSPWRKLVDAATAVRISQRESKQEVLEAYLDLVYFGHGLYGIDAAARGYFGVAPSSLTLSQASVLAGVIHAPTADDPLQHPLAARERQAQVLRSMVINGFITQDEGDDVIAQPLALVGGAVLPAMPGATVRPEAPVAGVPFTTGLIALAVGLVAAILMRRRDSALVRAVPKIAMIAGILVMARSLRAL